MMTRIRNALAAGAMGACALAVPVMTPAQAAQVDAPSVTENVKPCKHGKCHRHRHHRQNPERIPGGILNDDLNDNRRPGGSGGSGGIIN
ncbi:hypothetical protein ABZ470_11160 [Streptosporangium sp. NPDC020072]|uniref:hypothetical protein n=1 Tax=Streptosporangium sp. NPDC020072 TaxID=3154788 RepID=UPI003443C4A0